MSPRRVAAAAALAGRPAAALRRAFAGRPARAAVLAAVALAAGGWSFFDPFHAHVENGNRRASEGKTDEALAHYDSAAKTSPESPIPDFNRGLALAREGRADEAKAALQSAQAAADPGIAADAHYNLGNLLLEGKDTAGAIQEYLRSLDLDPTDADARRNLEIALRRREEEQRQPQPQQNPDQEQEPKEEGAPQQEPDEEGDPQESQGPEERKPDGEPEESPPSDAPQDSLSSSTSPPSGGDPQPQEATLSREDAARLLNAIQNDELRVLRSLDDRKEEETGVADDW